MHAIVSPQPLVAAIVPCESTTISLMPSPIYLFPDSTLPMDSPRVLLPPPRLKSPIQLIDSRCRPLSSIPKSLCTPSRSRGYRPGHSPRRRRHCLRVDCCTESGSHFFDQLPWSSSLDLSSDHSSPWDIADLSQLRIEKSVASHAPESGPGPIRRRKSSLRSSPLESGTECGPANCSSRTGSIPFPLRETPNRSPSPRAPVGPSHVRFHNLMPILSGRLY